VTVALCIFQCTFLEYVDIQINVSELYGAVCTADCMCIIVFARRDDVQTLDIIRKCKTDNVRINVTLRRVRTAIVAVEKQYVLHILSACL
jgi:RNase P/RNase MRP subunit POP5